MLPSRRRRRRAGHVAAAQELLRLGANVNATTLLGGETALHLATSNGDYPMVRMLVEEARADTHARNAQGHTAQKLAADNGPRAQPSQRATPAPAPACWGPGRGHAQRRT